MKENKFFSNEVLLQSEKAIELYNKYAKVMPIIDYHCHLKPKEIYENKTFTNITEAWLAKDHYKWRLMRANGVAEYFITGQASAKEKFFAWAETIERSMGNPVYQWAHMELNQFFGIREPLNSKTAETIWEKANSQLGSNGMTAQEIIAENNVKLIGTTDHPLDDLMYHELLEKEALPFQVIPTMRIDNLIRVDKGFLNQILEKTKVNIQTLTEYFEFMAQRVNYFSKRHCQSVDLGIGYLSFQPITTFPEQTFIKIVNEELISEKELADIQFEILIELSKLIAEKNWVMQLHIGAVGSVNNLAKIQLGTGTGFDTIVDQTGVVDNLLCLFNELNKNNHLPKTILYNMDGTKNTVIQTVMACFQANEAGIRGKIQHGPAWWLQDTKRGNRKQLEDLAEQGILMNFIGMTTDSRSFLSYARHDFFRRIVCDLVGQWINAGEMPDDELLISAMLESICYSNALNYFNLTLN